MNETARYKFLEHTTDAEIEAYGQNLDEAFENSGRALEDLMVDLITIRPEVEREILIEEKDLGALLYSWIEKLIFFQDTEGLVFSEFHCKISRNRSLYKLEARVLGEKFDPDRHEQKTAIKAPTFHDMEITTDKNQRVTMRFLVDL